MKHLLRYTLFLLTALLPMLAMAQVDPKIQVNKYVTENADGTYTLDLETYATGYTKQTEAYVATDFVLVLDRSGSMYSNTISTGETRMAALKKAVKDFLDLVYKITKEQNVDHRISIVWYAGSSNSTQTGMDTSKGSISPNIGFDYDLIKLTDANITSYKNAIDVVTNYNETNPKPAIGGGTFCDKGLEKAREILAGSIGDGRNKVTIFFTDGEPGGTAGKFHEKIAQNACKAAITLKSDDLKNEAYGGSGNSKIFPPVVYSIGIMNGGTADYHNIYSAKLNASGSKVTNDKYRFMHYVSSNYNLSNDNFPTTYTFGTDIEDAVCKDPNCTLTGTHKGSEDPHGYFMKSNGSDLSSIFAKIAVTEIKDRNENLGTTTVIKDALTDDFKLPDGADADDINLYTCAAKADNKTADLVWSTTGTGGEIVYKDADNKKVPAAVTGGHAEYWVPLTSVTPTISGKQVLVTGYDFKENFVGFIHDFTGNTNDNIAGWTGEKFIMEFVIERDPATPGADIELDTNTDKSGVYLSSSATDPLLAYPVPNVPVPNIIITKKGLAVGESAVFEVERVTSSDGTTPDATNVFKNTYILTKTGASDPSIEFVASGPGYYKVTEKTWTWNDKVTYDSGTDGTPDTEGTSYVQQLTNTDTKKQFTFGVGSSAKTGVLPRYQSEKNKNNKFTL